MPAYLVVKPCAYVNAAGAAVHHREGGAVAEIPEDVAAGLGDAVRPMVSGNPPDLVNPTPFPDADPTRGRRSRSGSAAEDTDG